MPECQVGFDEQRCRALAALINTWKRPLLLSHARADGDAVGSLLAMQSILRGLGRQPQAMLFEAAPRRYAWLPGAGTIARFERTDAESFKQADAVIIMDTCSAAQLEPVADWLKQTPLPKLAVDHHVTRDPLCDHYAVDESASATCLMIYEWARLVGWPLDDDARTALYVGIATDTGWFRFSNTDARTLEAAAALVRDGVRPVSVFEHVYQNESSARFRLVGAVLSQAELHHDERVAVLPVCRETFAATGAQASDTEELVNYPLQIATVQVSVLLIEQDNGTIRASFRSKPPSGGRPDIDVAALAAGFGGGGHRRAAAARVPGDIEHVKQAVIERVVAATTGCG